MGEIADNIYDGFLCQECMMVIDEDAPGYPRTCAECLEEAEEDNP